MDYSVSGKQLKGEQGEPVEERKRIYSAHLSYLHRFREERRDITRFLPATTLQTFPRQGNEGLYGWTHRQKDGIINVREDLQGEKKIKTIIHESIHTPDEYETRRLTEWIMESMFPEEEKYKRQIEYRR